MENTAEMQQNKNKPQGKRGFLGWCVVFFRWVFILLFAVILLGGLYFKVPWKILVVDAVLLALLTVVPKKKRKYGWLILAVAVLAVTVWILVKMRSMRMGSVHPDAVVPVPKTPDTTKSSPLMTS